MLLEVLYSFNYVNHFIICILILLVLGITHISSPKRKNLPPGPICLPVIGYLPFVGERPYITFSNLRRKYGNVFSLYLGSRYAIVLGNFLAVKEAFSKDAFLGRPPNAPNHVIQEAVSFSVSSGHVWREQRRFAMHALRNLGFGKHKMEDHMKNEIGYLLREMEAFKGQSCDIRRYLAPSTSNNISAFILGRRMDYTDPTRMLLDKVVDDLLKYFRPTGYHAFFPRLRSFLFKYEILGYKNVNSTVKEMLKFVDEEIQRHKETLDPENIRDYLDSYLLELEKQNEKKRSSTFTIPMLRGNTPSLFGAGGSTVRCTLEWALLVAAAFPDVQNLVQVEIDKVIGKERTPSWFDHVSMPYTESVLMEVQRWKTVVPINLVRYTLEDSTVQGFEIPKGTIVFANLWEVHHDPAFWENPDEFIADRFLSEDGQSVTKHQCYMPFTIGKRACPGESFANLEVFLYFTSILQKFRVLAPEGEDVSFEASLGVIYEPLPYRLRFIPREQ